MTNTPNLERSGDDCWQRALVVAQINAAIKAAKSAGTHPVELLRRVRMRTPK